MWSPNEQHCHLLRVRVADAIDNSCLSSDAMLGYVWWRHSLVVGLGSCFLI